MIKSQAFSLKSYSHVAHARDRPLAGLPSIALPSEGFAAGPSAASIPGGLGISGAAAAGLRAPAPTQAGRTTQARHRSRFTREGHLTGPRNFSPGTGPGNRSQAKPGGAGWSPAPRRRVNQRSPAPESPS